MDHIPSLRMSHLINLFYLFIYLFYIQIDPKSLENLLDIEQV